MNAESDRPNPAERGPRDSEGQGSDDRGSDDLAEHEKPEVGLIADEDLPEDLQPTEDNPLAQDPGEDDKPSSHDEPKVEGMPDMGSPGAPA